MPRGGRGGRGGRGTAADRTLRLTLLAADGHAPRIVDATLVDADTLAAAVALSTSSGAPPPVRLRRLPANRP